MGTKRDTARNVYRVAADPKMTPAEKAAAIDAIYRANGTADAIREAPVTYPGAPNGAPPAAAQMPTGETEAAAIRGTNVAYPGQAPPAGVPTGDQEAAAIRAAKVEYPTTVAPSLPGVGTAVVVAKSPGVSHGRAPMVTVISQKPPSPTESRGSDFLFPVRSAYNKRGDMAEAMGDIRAPAPTKSRGSDFLFPGRSAYNDRGDADEAKAAMPRTPAPSVSVPSVAPTSPDVRSAVATASEAPPDRVAPTDLYYDEGDDTFKELA